MDPQQLTITNRDRIERIIARICENSLQVTIRKIDGGNVVVKGRALKYFRRGDVSGIRIAQISANGLDYLTGVTQVQIEFSMMATKVAFVSLLLIREPSGIVVAVPNRLDSIERRKNARFAATADLGGFIVPLATSLSPLDSASPPVFSAYCELAGFLHVVDVSVGGLSAMTRYPRIPLDLRSGAQEIEALLYLPAQKPTAIKLGLRWSKTITEHLGENPGKTRSVAVYRHGFEFVDKKPEIVSVIGPYIQMLNHADAI
jgi:hypothetical protein